MTRKYSIVICDDQQLIRESLSIILNQQPHLEVVGEAADGQAAVQLVLDKKPDLVLMDIRMPVMNGIEATRKIHETFPDIKIVVLTTFEEDELIIDCLKAGALSYLLKDISSDDLIKAIGLVCEGESILPAATIKTLVTSSLGQTKKPAPPPKDLLTARELEVLQYLMEGYNNKELARKLVVSEATVKNHLSNIFNKLNVRDRLQAVIFAIQHNLIQPRFPSREDEKGP